MSVNIKSAEKDIITIYQDNREEWRWRRKSSNGNIVGSSSKGYKNKQDCKDNVKLILCTIYFYLCSIKKG
ncbi:YegP family protein [Aliarcobacter butzleri]|uniref:YegP family protein n=1 Tax=Aliarcobacter butzleri TaxID=28197 RepID=UPI0002295C6F|nr:DUF1508 domain-containing protein [Aliarcobacter butzleri]MCG3688228.1 DUF1508 domain-containing protein [Aliarcobacter butzleri]BAK70953.1 hypothetical protein ABED_1236 [Aliarcobacter butzleri ED-1]